MEAWQELSDLSKIRKLHQNYQQKWMFRPHTKNFPSIREPVPSLTYQISFIYGGTSQMYQELETDLCSNSLKAFQRCQRKEEPIFSTDVFHYDYLLYPHIKFAAKNPENWKVPLIPNGEYSIFVLDCGNMGFFGHPWEQTICIFGAALIESYEVFKPKIFQHLVRRNGKKVAEFGLRSQSG